MKITQEHLAHIKQAIAPVDTPELRGAYKQSGLSDMRYRWDVMRKAGLSSFITDTLYSYLNDTHIDSALRACVRLA